MKGGTGTHCAASCCCGVFLCECGVRVCCVRMQPDAGEQEKYFGFMTMLRLVEIFDAVAILVYFS